MRAGNFHRVSGTKVPQLKREQSDTLGRVCPVIILDEVASERVKADNVAGWTVVVVKGLPYEAVAKSYKVRAERFSHACCAAHEEAAKAQWFASASARQCTSQPKAETATE